MLISNEYNKFVIKADKNENRIKIKLEPVYNSECCYAINLVVTMK